MGKRRESNAHCEGGLAAVLLALMLPVLIALTALVIDLNRLMIARDAANSYSNLAALAGASAYYSASCAVQGEQLSKEDCAAARLLAAIDRIEEVSQGNLIFRRRSEIVGVGPSDGPSWLELGRWWSKELERGSPECGNLGKTAPCMIPWNVQDEGYPNSFRVYWNYESKASVFARSAFRVSSIPLAVESIATLVPRVGAFLVDVSLSTVRQSHPRWRTAANTNPPEPLCGRGHQYAWSFDPGVTPSLSDPNLPDYLFSGALPDQFGYDRQWEWLREDYPERGTTCTSLNEASGEFYCPFSQQTYHCANDYLLKRSLGDAHYEFHPAKDYHPSPEEGDGQYAVGDVDGQWHLIDARDGSTPDPLSTVYLGIRSAIGGFRERRVGGDRALIALHDNRLEWPRMVKPIDDWEYLENFVDFNDVEPEGGYQFHSDREWLLSSPPSYDDPINFGLSASGRERLVRHRGFPIGNRFTDLKTPIMWALQEFQQLEEEIPSSKFITIITDGLDICTLCPTPSLGQVDYEFPFSCIPDTQNCSNTFENHRNAMQELTWVVENTLRPANIPLHIIAVGSETIGQHTVAFRDAQGHCLTDHDFRTSLPDNPGRPFDSFVKGISGGEEALRDAFYGFEPYYQVNVDLYRLAAMTQGIWSPIRPPATNCYANQFHFDSEGRRRSACPANGTRELNDPYCRPAGQQIVEAMAKILSDSPFRIVRESGPE